MKTKQLLLEILLLHERYTVEEINSVKDSITDDKGVLDCLLALNKLNQSTTDKQPISQTESSKPEKPTKQVNLKKALSEVRKEDEEKYKVIKKIEAIIRDTKMMKISEMREYATLLHMTIEPTIKRDKLIRQILIHLINLPTDQIVAPTIDSKTNIVNQLEIISEAIYHFKKD
ncbi:hypothetical protein [Bacillus sp. PS06]|uniref:hypothetical protein n=1 Tax=Bacillus sp. PS06 TaxID=2764176 RepID=UPI0017833117|nr:hypothetical protein [Bacillus sp. PS06]MBD8068810.1 hypothetical protein [Bacillus sp. PS06]